MVTNLSSEFYRNHKQTIFHEFFTRFPTSHIEILR